MIDSGNMTTYKQYAAILIGGSLCLPVIMVGFELAQIFGTVEAIMSIGIGNLLLCAMALLMAKITLISRSTTLGLAIQAFGRTGLPWFALMLVALMLGWFAIQLDVISTNIQLLIVQYGSVNIPQWINCLIIGSLMICVSLTGLRMISTLASYILLPLIVTIMMALGSSWLREGTMVVNPSMLTVGSLCASISIVLATMLALVLDLPTFIRMAQSKRDAYKGLCITFILGVPLIELVGVVFASFGGAENSLMHHLLSGSYAWQLLASTCFIVTGVISNVLNLYSAAASLQTAMPQYSLRGYSVVGGILASCVAALGIVHNVTVFLDALGIFMGSMGVGIIGWHIHCVYSCAYTRVIITVTLVAGITAGLSHVLGIFTLTPSALLDAVIVSGCTYLVSTLCVQLFNYQDKYEIVNKK